MVGSKQTLRLDTVDLAAIVNRVAALTREAVRRRGAVLNIDCPQQAGWVVGDATRLKQTLYHLLITALNAVEQSALSLRVARNGEHAEVTLRYAAAGENAPSFDHGALGLHFARRMAELHGGAVEVDTTGPEAVLVCRLPAAPLRSASVG